MAVAASDSVSGAIFVQNEDLARTEPTLRSNKRHKRQQLMLSKKNVGFYARHLISRTETRKNVGQFSVNFLESDKMLGYWLSFYANRLERTRFVILAELSPKKADINFETYSSTFNAIQS